MVHVKYLFLPYLILFISGCNNLPEEETLKVKNNKDLTLKIPNGLLVVQFYKIASPEIIYQLNSQDLKEGNGFSYFESGALLKKTRWEKGLKEGEEITYDESGQITGIFPYKKGVQDGDVLLFSKGSLFVHRLLKMGQEWYEGCYHGHIKYLNKIYPVFVEAFFFEDKYYAKIRFPLAYAGKLTVKVKDKGTAIIEQLKDQTFQIVINDALDLNRVELELSYHPAPGDTLVHSSYSHEYVIYSTE